MSLEQRFGSLARGGLGARLPLVRHVVLRAHALEPLAADFDLVGNRGLGERAGGRQRSQLQTDHLA
jgi:hypothetical protein